MQSAADSGDGRAVSLPEQGVHAVFDIEKAWQRPGARGETVKLQMESRETAKRKISGKAGTGWDYFGCIQSGDT